MFSFCWGWFGFFLSQLVINTILLSKFMIVCNQLANESQRLLLVSNYAQTHYVIHLNLLSRSRFLFSKTVLLAAKGTLATFGFICTLELSSAFELSDSVNHPLVRRHRPLSRTRVFFDGS